MVPAEQDQDSHLFFLYIYVSVDGWMLNLKSIPK